MILVTAQGQAISGQTTLSNNERQWSFVPAKPWSPGAYHIVVQAILEDLAGNNVGKPFEVDVVAEPVRPGTNSPLSLTFIVN
jgi:hypothetical protein